MKSDAYLSNRQLLLFMVRELHKLGFEKLRVIPSISPSGLHWRCQFINTSKYGECYASNWIGEKEINAEEIKLSAGELANEFIKDNPEFMEPCKGKNKEYTKWYSEMLDGLQKGELPFAFSDDYSRKGYWKTNLENEIKTLSDERF